MPAQKFGSDITAMLVRLTQCGAPQNLPTLYTDLAGRCKGESEQMILEKAFATAASALGVHIKPRATPGYVMAVKTFRFTGDQHYDVGHGILILSLVPPGAVSTAARKQAIEDQQQADAFDTNQCSDNVQGGVNVNEINKMHNLKGYTATEWNEASLQLKAMLPVLGGVLGAMHPVTTEYQVFLKQCKSVETRLRAALQRKYGERAGAVLFACHVQLKLHNWFESQTEHGNINTTPPPNFLSDLDTFCEGGATYWMPDGEDVDLFRPILAARTPTRPPPAPTAGGGRGVRAGEDLATAPATRVANNHHDPRLTADEAIAPNVRSRTVTEAIARGGGHQ